MNGRGQFFVQIDHSRKSNLYVEVFEGCVASNVMCYNVQLFDDPQVNPAGSSVCVGTRPSISLQLCRSFPISRKRHQALSAWKVQIADDGCGSPRACSNGTAWATVLLQSCSWAGGCVTAWSRVPYLTCRWIMTCRAENPSPQSR